MSAGHLFAERIARGPVSVVVALRVPVDEALARLRQAIDGGASVKTGGASSDRRLSGMVSAEEIRLLVPDARWTRRRVGWRVEFRGRMESGPGHGTLRGVVEMVDTNPVRRWLWLFRLAALVPLVLGVVAAAAQRDSSPQLGSLLWGAGIAVAAFVAIAILKVSVERAAADDAKVLNDYLRAQLG